MDPDQTAHKGSSLITFHSVCLHEKVLSEVSLNICCRHKKQKTFSGQKKVGGLRVNWLQTPATGLLMNKLVKYNYV